MESLDSKQLSLLRVLQIFRQYSDFDHTLTQNDVLDYLERDYGIILERKSVGRKISLLKEAGVNIETVKSGSYLDSRDFTDSELRMLIDGVLSSKYITAKHSKEMIDKLCSLSNQYFKSHIKNVYSVGDWNKTENQSVFYNIEIIDDAIESGMQITFDYNKYSADKKLHKTATHTASPYQLILHNQKYYLMALNEHYKNMAYFKVDRITDIKITNEPITPINTVDGYQNGIDYSAFSSSLPYMFSDKFERVKFYADEKIADQIIDWFGLRAGIEKAGDRLLVTVNVSPNAMEYWSMQYLNSVEIIEPAYLREKIKENLRLATEKYE